MKSAIPIERIILNAVEEFLLSFGVQSKLWLADISREGR